MELNSDYKDAAKREKKPGDKKVEKADAARAGTAATIRTSSVAIRRFMG